ncbi:MAG: alpha-N-acetylglucosaminidase [Limisphaerales bacterium]
MIAARQSSFSAWCVAVCLLIATPFAAHAETNAPAAASAVIQRLLPAHAANFVCEMLPAADGQDVFEIASRDGKIVLRGNRAIAITSAFNHYLKHVARGHLSWCGDQLNLPVPLPLPAETIRCESPYRHGFAFNYCTFNYTMAWWDWPRWEREIDFMAANGVDLPLAITGTEAVWLNVLTRFGYTTNEAKAFIPGPGYTAWWLMGNLQGRGGPVTDEWIASRVELQRKILGRMRELGMRPVLPGFVGLVPTTLAAKIPGTRLLPQGKWLADQRPAVLHPDDPLFDRLGAAWYEELEKLYGRADVFAGDLFHEGGNPHGLSVPAIARRVQSLMLDYNPNSVWVLQGWGGNPRADLLAALQPQHTLVLELCSEFYRNWEPNQGFGGTPWIFSTVVIYGGNVALHGRLQAIADNLAAARQCPNPPAGLGMTWESIESNPVVNDFLWDLRWRSEVPSLTNWIGDYAVRRYGRDTPAVREAWTRLLHSAYGTFPNHRRPTESILCARPSLDVKKVSPFAASIHVHYDQRELRDAILQLLTLAPECGGQPTYRYDLVDFTRQFLANLAQIPYREMVAAFKRGDRAGFERAATDFLAVLDDQNRLLESDAHFLLGKWLADARAVAPSPAQADQNEQNTRWLITTWTRERSGLGDYAWREWNGLLQRYYRPRWELFITDLLNQLNGAKPQPLNYFRLESEWAARTWERDDYPTRPRGDPVALARQMMERWGPVLDDPARYTPPQPAALAQAPESAQDAR